MSDEINVAEEEPCRQGGEDEDVRGIRRGHFDRSETPPHPESESGFVPDASSSATGSSPSILSTAGSSSSNQRHQPRPQQQQQQQQPHQEQQHHLQLHSLLSIPALYYLWLGKMSSTGRNAVCILAAPPEFVEEACSRSGDGVRGGGYRGPNLNVVPYGLCTLNSHPDERGVAAMEALDAIRAISKVRSIFYTLSISFGVLRNPINTGEIGQDKIHTSLSLLHPLLKVVEIRRRHLCSLRDLPWDHLGAEGEKELLEVATQVGETRSTR